MILLYRLHHLTICQPYHIGLCLWNLRNSFKQGLPSCSISRNSATIFAPLSASSSLDELPMAICWGFSTSDVMFQNFSFCLLQRCDDSYLFQPLFHRWLLWSTHFSFTRLCFLCHHSRLQCRHLSSLLLTSVSYLTNASANWSSISCGVVCNLFGFGVTSSAVNWCYSLSLYLDSTIINHCHYVCLNPEPSCRPPFC